MNLALDYNLDPPEPIEFPECPVCSSTYYQELFFDMDGNLCGCSDCMSKYDAAEYWADQWEREKERHEEIAFDAWREEQRCGSH